MFLKANTTHRYYLFFLLSFFSCGNSKTVQKNNITDITYTAINGGKGASFFSLKIRKDSILYIVGNRNLKKQKTVKTPPKIWTNLLLVKLKKFDSIKSQPSKTKSDGTDFTVSIIENNNTHTFTNGKINSDNVKYFLNLLSKEQLKMESLNNNNNE